MNKEDNSSNLESKTDFGFKTVAESQKAKLVENVFHSVAQNYDLMNDLMSLGLHRLWKKFTFFTSELKSGDKILDIAGGTGDMSKGFKQIVGNNGEVWHTDINSSMLSQGRKRLINQGILTPSCLCDAENLPFPDNYFDAVCVAFGLRNMTHKEIALQEMFRVLKPGGIVMVLEFSQINPLFKGIYDIYSFKMLPWLGKIIAKDSSSYQYLAESIRKHPDQETLKAIIEKVGFNCVKYYNLNFGITALHKGYKI